MNNLVDLLLKTHKYLNISASSSLAHDVLRLEVQMDDVLLVHMTHTLADLSHVVRCLRL